MYILRLLLFNLKFVKNFVVNYVYLILICYMYIYIMYTLYIMKIGISGMWFGNIWKFWVNQICYQFIVKRNIAGLHFVTNIFNVQQQK